MKIPFKEKQPFCPPKPVPWLIGFFKFILPLLNRYCQGNLKVKFQPEDIQKLKALRGYPMLLMPNHPQANDPFIPFALSKAVGENFYFVAARELFSLQNGFWGFVLQRCGVYSVIRGAADRESFKTSREILAKGDQRLVIFIEGEVSNENDTLIPFEPGVIQLAFWGLEEQLKQEQQKQKELNQEKSSQEPSKPVDKIPGIYITPVAIKYLYDPGVEKYMLKALNHLEKSLNLPPPEKENESQSLETIYQRILNIAGHLLNFQEKRLNITPAQDASMNQRLEIFKEKLLNKMELFLDIPASTTAQQSFLERIRGVRNRIDKIIYSYQEVPHLSEYEENLLELQRQEVSGFYKELERVVNLLVLREGSIADLKTPERFMDVIRRLEREVYGQPLTEPPRTALVQMGEIQNIKDYYSQYEANKKLTVQEIASNLEANMHHMLAQVQKI
ncbi:MAG: 1-acyl-sn-glycerol-3-phosphate acyltransferase [Cyanobacteria bacterium]|nr:1-acyl-sn-glycerol-3-phosphate acyltransferase [Cyanobacteriota bacterium]